MCAVDSGRPVGNAGHMKKPTQSYSGSFLSVPGLELSVFQVRRCNQTNLLFYFNLLTNTKEAAQ